MISSLHMMDSKLVLVCTYIPCWDHFVFFEGLFNAHTHTCSPHILLKYLLSSSVQASYLRSLTLFLSIEELKSEKKGKSNQVIGMCFLVILLLLS